MNSKKVLDSVYYRFEPSQKKIYFSPALRLMQSDILMIVNSESNVMIYNFACIEEGGKLSGNVLSLSYNTTSMGRNDRLMVIISVPDTTENYLKKICELLEDQNEMLKNVIENQN